MSAEDKKEVETAVEEASKKTTTVKEEATTEKKPAAKKTTAEEKKPAAKKPAAKKAPAKKPAVKRVTKSSPVKDPYASRGVGRRKSAIARAFLKEGKGDIIINRKPAEEFFQNIVELKHTVLKPLEVTGAASKFDFLFTVKGGGIKAQGDAVALSMAKAMINFDESFRPLLREHGLLTTDSRKVESKRYGLRKARRREQYKKR